MMSADPRADAHEGSHLAVAEAPAPRSMDRRRRRTPAPGASSPVSVLSSLPLKLAILALVTLLSVIFVTPSGSGLVAAARHGAGATHATSDIQFDIAPSAKQQPAILPEEEDGPAAGLPSIDLSAPSIAGVRFARPTFSAQEDAGHIMITFLRQAVDAQPLDSQVVYLSIAEDTAVESFDYESPSDLAVRFGKGEVVAMKRIRLFDNYWPDGTRRAILRLSSSEAGHALGDADVSAILEITDDEPAEAVAPASGMAGDAAGGRRHGPRDLEAEAEEASPYIRFFGRAVATPTLVTTEEPTTTSTTTTETATSTPTPTPTVTPTEAPCERGCDGECDSGAVVDRCGVCRKIDPNQPSDGPSPVEDCAGICYGQAFINECGICVAGSTQKDPSAGKDQCGVCGGDDTSCVGCDGVPNSGVENDACGVCGGDNSTCIILLEIDPDVGPNAPEQPVQLIGGGFTEPGTDKPRELYCRVQDNKQARIPVRVISNTRGECILDSFTSTGPKDFELIWVENPGDPGVAVPNKLVYTVLEQLPSIVLDQVVKVYIDRTDQRILVNGTNFFDPDTLPGGNGGHLISCRYSYDGEAGMERVSYARYISSKQIECPVPVSSVSQDAWLTIGFSGRPGGPWSTVKVWVKYYQVAPVAELARLDSTGSLLLVYFNVPVTTPMNGPGLDSGPGAGTFKCQTFFPARTAELFGSGAKCTVRSGSRVVEVALGQNPAIRTGVTMILFERETIYELARQYCDPLDNDLLVDTDTPPPVPVAVITAPEEASTCGAVHIHGRASYGNTGGQALRFHWTFSPPLPAGSYTTNNGASLDSLTVTDIHIKKDVFANGAVLRITLKVSNYVAESLVAEHTIRFVNSPVPSITVRGINPRRVNIDEETVIAMDATPSECDATDTALSFEWTLTPEDFQNGHSLSELVLTGPTLVIPPNFLQPYTQYTATLRATSDKSKATSSHGVILNTLPPSLNVRLLGGDRRTIGSYSDLHLYYTIADYARLEGREVTIELRCTNELNGALCPVTDGFGGFTTLSFAPQSVTLDPALESNRFVRVVPAGQLVVSEKLRYRFELRVTDNLTGELKTDVAVIVPRAGVQPFVLLDTERKIGARHDWPLAITVASSRSTAYAQLNYTWSCVHETTDQELAQLLRDIDRHSELHLEWVDINDPAIHSGPINGDTLILEPFTLRPNARYAFRLDVVEPQTNKRAHSIVIVRTSPAPVGGSISVTPAVGARAAFDLVQVAMTGWTTTTDQLPLSYRVELRYPDGRTLQVPTDGPGSALAFLADPGNRSRSVTVRGVVTQRNGVSSVVQTDVVVDSCVVRTNSELEELRDIYRTRSAQMVQRGQWERLMAWTSVVSSCLDATEKLARSQAAAIASASAARRVVEQAATPATGGGPEAATTHIPDEVLARRGRRSEVGEALAAADTAARLATAESAAGIDTTGMNSAEVEALDSALVLANSAKLLLADVVVTYDDSLNFAPSSFERAQAAMCQIDTVSRTSRGLSQDMVGRLVTRMTEQTRLVESYYQAPVRRATSAAGGSGAATTPPGGSNNAAPGPATLARVHPNVMVSDDFMNCLARSGGRLLTVTNSTSTSESLLQTTSAIRRAQHMYARRLACNQEPATFPSISADEDDLGAEAVQMTVVRSPLKGSDSLMPSFTFPQGFGVEGVNCFCGFQATLDRDAYASVPLPIGAMAAGSRETFGARVRRHLLLQSRSLSSAMAPGDGAHDDHRGARTASVAADAAGLMAGLVDLGAHSLRSATHQALGYFEEAAHQVRRLRSLRSATPDTEGAVAAADTAASTTAASSTMASSAAAVGGGGGSDAGSYHLATAIHSAELYDCSTPSAIGEPDTFGQTPITSFGGQVVQVGFEFDPADPVDIGSVVCAYLNHTTYKWDSSQVFVLEATPVSVTCGAQHFTEFAVLQRATASEVFTPDLGDLFPAWAIALIVVSALVVLSALVIGMYVVHRRRQLAAVPPTPSEPGSRVVDYSTMADGQGQGLGAPPAFKPDGSAYPPGSTAGPSTAGTPLSPDHMVRRPPAYVLPPSYADFVAVGYQGPGSGGSSFGPSPTSAAAGVGAPGVNGTPLYPNLNARYQGGAEYSSNSFEDFVSDEDAYDDENYEDYEDERDYHDDDDIYDDDDDFESDGGMSE
ncbi:hypothetical protein H696_00598 [Fonticula alba]|uniref:PKD/REJ-like domain-containing protein n=1 Tax=Fonticula alba TaxID=691883 RepID=A0A058ZGG6_FONAL|nr:hypothetical protein H696_00598 [Fonticula alba]KCV73051.1 hypothetical protein H696_00598 [Fonticula alba]|eukprot:XP_009492752.1 hypothetical protein H696_00598 [Fonticula alba]